MCFDLSQVKHIPNKVACQQDTILFVFEYNYITQEVKQKSIKNELMGYININTVQTTFYWPFQPKQRQILKFWLKKFFYHKVIKKCLAGILGC